MILKSMKSVKSKKLVVSLANYQWFRQCKNTCPAQAFKSGGVTEKPKE
jgi:hypothetical protein